MRKVYIDYDGVLAKFNKEKSLEEVAMKGYSLSLEPIEGMVNAVKRLVKKVPNAEFYLLSAVLNQDCEDDKNIWCDCHLPEIDKEHRFFVPYGIQKEEYLRSKGIELNETDILIDDFTKNLDTWHGIGVKFLNGINNTHGTWKGLMVNGKSEGSVIATALLGIILATYADAA